MSAANIVIREFGEESPLTTFTITASAGTPTDPIAFDLFNSGTEQAKDIRLAFYERAIAEEGWFQDRPLIANRYLEVRVTAPYTTGWTPVGLARPFRVSPIDGEGITSLEMRANIPGGEFDSTVEVGIEPQWNRGFTVPGAGFFAAGLQGISSGVGDGSRTFIISADPITASGSPDDEIHIGDILWITAGELLVKLLHDLAFTADAADGPLSAGEAYWATLSLAADGTITVTKSNGDTSPLSISARPAAPEGEIVRAWVHVEEDLTIADADIYDAAEPGSFAIYGTGLDRPIGAGVALVSDRLIDPDNPDAIAFPADEAAIEVYLLPNGSKQASIDGRPDDRALLLYSASTDSDDLTSLVDQRPFLRTRPSALIFRFDAELIEDAVSYRTAVSSGGDVILTYPIACRATLDDEGDTPTAGQTIIDVEYWNGAAWTTIFTSFASVDRRPTIEWDATDLSANGIPEVRRFAAGTRFRARIADVPTATAGPSGAELVLYFEEPGS